MSWGRQSYRMGPLDFKAASHDGYGDDWPVTYEEMVPYFEEVERYVGISGSAENLIQLPDSIFLPAMPMTCGEIVMRDAAAKKMNRVVTIGRAAVLTKPQNGRQACHYCGPCERGCVTSSYFNSVTTTIPDAVKTGRLTLLTNAVAANIVMADGGKCQRCPLYRFRNKRGADGNWESRRALRFNSGIHTPAAQFEHLQFQRRARSLLNGQHLRRRSFGHTAYSGRPTVGRHAAPAQWHLRSALSQRGSEGDARPHGYVHSWIRLPRWQFPAVRFFSSWIRQSLQRRRASNAAGTHLWECGANAWRAWTTL